MSVSGRVRASCTVRCSTVTWADPHRLERAGDGERGPLRTREHTADHRRRRPRRATRPPQRSHGRGRGVHRHRSERLRRCSRRHRKRTAHQQRPAHVNSALPANTVVPIRRMQSATRPSCSHRTGTRSSGRSNRRLASPGRCAARPGKRRCATSCAPSVRPIARVGTKRREHAASVSARCMSWWQMHELVVFPGPQPLPPVATNSAASHQWDLSRRMK